MLSAAVVGGGLAGLVSARELARAGYSVTVFEAAASFGGAVKSLSLAGLALDAGAESFATARPATKELLARLGLAEDIVEPDSAGAWVLHRDGAFPLPRTALFGIPADPDAPEVAAVLGARGVRRAREDSRLPHTPGSIDADVSIGELVRARMGADVLERLVSPIVAGVHSASAFDLPVRALAPGLLEELDAHGSLAAAVKSLKARQNAKAGGSVAGLRGGMHRLVDSLLAELASKGVRLEADAKVCSLERSGTQWLVGAARGPAAEFSALVFAAAPQSVASLVEGVDPDIAQTMAAQRSTPVYLETLLVDCPALDDHPRGTGVLVAPAARADGPKALTHNSAKWHWLAEQLPPGRHIVRMSFSRPPGLRSQDMMRQDAARLLGIAVDPGHVVDSRSVAWEDVQPAPFPDHRETVGAVRGGLAASGTIGLVGAWASGTGIGAVVSDTETAISAMIDQAG